MRYPSDPNKTRLTHHAQHHSPLTFHHPVILLSKPRDKSISSMCTQMVIHKNEIS